ncbi:MAG: hypothetical protein KAT71_04740 [Gammaproteobacteria bacterium]|nr:hypothetical protein [Gammaproteobacteria bacterium]
MIKKSQQGIGLLELMLSLAIIAGLLLAASRYFQNTMLSKNVADTIDIARAMSSAGQSYLLTNTAYPTSEIWDTFVDNGLLPNSFPSNTNPWGGKLTFTGQPADGGSHLGPYITLTMNNIPAKACASISGQSADLVCDSIKTDYISCQTTDGQLGFASLTINLDSQCPPLTS